MAENIAFGVPRKDIDMAARDAGGAQAQIADFIEARPDGYDAWVGERGIRLSGGQRQRIGIARALYKRASVLVFDEATSALDNATEQSVMDAIEGLDRELTDSHDRAPADDGPPMRCDRRARAWPGGGAGHL